MTRIFLLIISAFTVGNVFAQTQKFYTIQPGGNLLDIVPKSDAYEFPQFEQGIVFLKNGFQFISMQNLYLVIRQVRFK